MIPHLKRRFTLITLSILLTVFLAIFISTYGLMSESEKIQSIKIMEELAKNDGNLSHPLAPEPKKWGHFKEAPFNPLLLQSSFIFILNQDNQMVDFISHLPSGTTIDSEQTLIEKVLAKNEETGTISFEGLNLRYLVQQRTIDQKIIVFLDRSPELATLTRLTIILFGIGSLSLIILTAISYYLASWAIRPIAKSYELQQQFMADASHELKTPIAVIKTTLDVLIAHKHHTIEAEQKWMTYLQTETERMEKLVNDLLFLSKNDSQELKIEFTPFQLSDALMNVILPFESVAFESNKRLELDIEPDLLGYGDVSQLQQVVVILLDNALKHAFDKTTIYLSLKQQASSYQLMVQNEGIPIANDDLSKIFDRFYRADSSRARETGGYGLGLAIAKSIITKHHGTISVTSTLEGKTTFSITLPSKPPLMNKKRKIPLMKNES